MRGISRGDNQRRKEDDMADVNPIKLQGSGSKANDKITGMVTRIITCYHCDSENIVKNGKAPNGKQKYLCHECGRQSREDPQSNAYMRPKGARRSLAPTTRNAPASGAFRAPSGSRATP